MQINILGKFYDNHSLSIINRNLALELAKQFEISITPMDSFDSANKVDVETIGKLQVLANNNSIPDIQIRHSYPLYWNWPDSNSTKIVYIQPWEFMAMPSEWQYKFDTFADGIITPSKWTLDVYANSGIDPSKMWVVPNGYNSEVFNTNNRPDKDIIRFVFVGCGQYRKGLDTLLDVWSKITNSKDSIELVIKDTPQVYGYTDLYDQLLRLQYKTKCGRITYDDTTKSEQEMADFYKSADFIVHPYRGEGFGMHIQEAMACGVTPIVTAGGPTDEFVNDYKIDSTREYADFTKIFAIKPGDSVSLMGQHKWVLEPNKQHLASILENIIRKNTTAALDISRLNTWTEVGIQYANVLREVNNIKIPKRKR